MPAELVRLPYRVTNLASQLVSLHTCRIAGRRTLDALDVALLRALRDNPRAGAL